MRASIDWPNCPTTTRSSLIPCRNGPKISCQGVGSWSFVLRNARGTSAHDAASPSPDMITCPGCRPLSLRGKLDQWTFVTPSSGTCNAFIRHLYRLHRVTKLGQIAYVTDGNVERPLREQRQITDCLHDRGEGEDPWVTARTSVTARIRGMV